MIIRRRGFLTVLGGLSAAIGAAPVLGAAPVVDPLPPTAPAPSEDFQFQAYRMHWTGWKATMESAALAGQWLGWPLRGYGESDVPDRQPYFYVSVPGFAGGLYRPGANFDLTSHGRVIDRSTPDDQRQTMLAEGLVYLKGLVVTFGQEPARPGHTPLFHFPVSPEDFARSVAYYHDLDQPEYQCGFPVKPVHPLMRGGVVYGPGQPFVLR